MLFLFRSHLKPSVYNREKPVKFLDSSINKMSPSSLVLLLCLLPVSSSHSQTFLQLLPETSATVGDDSVQSYCNSWRLAVETDNAGHWKNIPSRCHDTIEAYVKGPRYILDSKVAARHANTYAKSIKVAGDRKDVWIFDVDETLISNLQHYTANGYV